MAVLIIFPVILQTVIDLNLRILSIGGQGTTTWLHLWHVDSVWSWLWITIVVLNTKLYLVCVLLHVSLN